jgi:hypothetical protein
MGRTLQIQRQQPLQDFFIGHVGGVVAPAVGLRDGRVQPVQGFCTT